MSSAAALLGKIAATFAVFMALLVALGRSIRSRRHRKQNHVSEATWATATSRATNE